MATAQVYENGGIGWRNFAGGDIPASGVTAGTYGDSTHVAQVSVNTEGQVTAASNVAISGGGGGGPTEISYTEFTADLNITATTEGTAQTVVAAPAQTFDGATKVQLQFFSPSVSIDAGDNIFVEFFDGATPLGWSYVNGNAAGAASNFMIGATLELTPSAASHTYSVRAYTQSGGTQTIHGGTGGTLAYRPGFIRIVTVI